MLSIVRILRSWLSGLTGSVHSMRVQPRARAQYSAAARLRAIYPNLLQLLYDNTRTRAQQADFTMGAAADRSPMALFEQLYAQQNGQEMDAAQRALLSGMMERIWEDEA